MIIPSGSFVYFQILSFVWFGIGAVFMLALAKGLMRVCGCGGGRCQWNVPSEAIRKMNGALWWRHGRAINGAMSIMNGLISQKQAEKRVIASAFQCDSVAFRCVKQLLESFPAFIASRGHIFGAGVWGPAGRWVWVQRGWCCEVLSSVSSRTDGPLNYPPPRRPFPLSVPHTSIISPGPGGDQSPTNDAFVAADPRRTINKRGGRTAEGAITCLRGEPL